MFLLHEEHDGSRFSTIEERIIVVYVDMIGLADGDEMTWILDNGATIHATSHKDLFTNYKTGNFGVVKMGNNDQAQMIGRGDVHLQTKNGTPLVLKSVRHVEALRPNTISVALLDGDEYLSKFGNAQYMLSKGNLIVLNVTWFQFCIILMLRFLLLVSMRCRNEMLVF
jgi:hypothetical protein